MRQVDVQIGKQYLCKLSGRLARVKVIGVEEAVGGKRDSYKRRQRYRICRWPPGPTDVLPLRPRSAAELRPAKRQVPDWPDTDRVTTDCHPPPRVVDLEPLKHERVDGGPPLSMEPDLTLSLAYVPLQLREVPRKLVPVPVPVEQRLPDLPAAVVRILSTEIAPNTRKDELRERLRRHVKSLVILTAGFLAEEHPVVHHFDLLLADLAVATDATKDLAAPDPEPKEAP